MDGYCKGLWNSCTEWDSLTLSLLQVYGLLLFVSEDDGLSEEGSLFKSYQHYLTITVFELNLRRTPKKFSTKCWFNSLELDQMRLGLGLFFFLLAFFFFPSQGKTNFLSSSPDWEDTREQEVRSMLTLSPHICSIINAICTGISVGILLLLGQSQVNPIVLCCWLLSFYQGTQAIVGFC